MRRVFSSLLTVLAFVTGTRAVAFPLAMVPQPVSGADVSVDAASADQTGAAIIRRNFISPGDAGLCAQAALSAERSTRIPDQFLVAMGRVESGRHLPNGQFVAWPWTVNAQGKGYVYSTRQQAIDAVHAFQDQGIRSIDVGCLQVNLLQHADAFSSLEAAFDPMTNARYAARFLADLFTRTGSWPRAAAAYHSFTPDIGTVYQWKVLESWAMPADASSGSVSVPRFSGGGRPVPPVPHTSQPVVAYATKTGNSNLAMSQAPAQSTFHPAIHGYNPPPSRPAITGGSGRTLASYRASPVHMIRQTMMIPARF
ncbi:transglycosylase SLT domain-containing protein [Acetobacter fallax]|uniref:Transglycosylase SLT domain-containing protein n=1 Tax=Acetobacter fallax TaxID=1737473 RepID=A0ABX0K955_9PROT|nr:transglycosylase SLT domain-containing protein [Acetobacter fallax]NHO31949.1 transglycosylase SLT domain-containing protein [Acetobacter fallax]NHO35535.1 transglycosylase SLT domain-containing protein [Acetobacter fallax]